MRTTVTLHEDKTPQSIVGTTALFYRIRAALMRKFSI
uniref:Cytoplasmic protein n=1 Tax=Ascaris lumbricoides TaxID=6252 RepID=A0A0M3HMC6_ASCLU